MAVTDWVLDTSALARLNQDAVAETLIPRINRGLVSVLTVTALEMGWTARSSEDRTDTLEPLLTHLLYRYQSPAAEDRAVEIQRELTARGHHRAVAPPDLLVAAVAERDDLVVLHYDADFDLVADVTGQPTEWVVPAGTV